MNKMSKLIRSDGFNNAMSSIFAIIIGLIFGFIVLLISNPNQALSGFIIILQGGFSTGAKGIGQVLYFATPLILTGLSVGFAFKTGLFNIGAEGQFIMGALVATLVGVGLDLPAIIHIPLTIIAAAVAGGVWGAISGFLKSKFGINEVIVCIMLNWIAFYFSNFMVSTSFISVPNSESSVSINESASISINWLKGLVGPATSVNWGIVISIVLVFVVWFVLSKTTLGFELKAVGHNKDAAEYAGIDVSKSMLKSMAIAGILAGIAGAIQVMGVTHNITVLAAQEGYGFDGIAVALIANSNPIGVIFSGLLFGAFKYGGIKMQSVNAPSEVINIVIGSIVYFIALSNGLRILYKKMKEKKAKGGAA